VGLRAFREVKGFNLVKFDEMNDSAGFIVLKQLK